jgi:hypothetical protein
LIQMYYCGSVEWCCRGKDDDARRVENRKDLGRPRTEIESLLPALVSRSLTLSNIQ